MKNKGREFEKKFIKTINSGAFFQKGDAVSDNECLEIKYTEKMGFRITTKLLRKLWEEAFSQNKLPVLGIGIKDGNDIWLIKCQIEKEKNS